ncbi:MAG: hypothetical protein ABWX94_02680 [Candidatus Saccharimonadales bacterium]
MAQGSSSIAQQFQAKDSTVTAASLVNIAKDNPSFVELSDSEHADQLAGIVSDKPLIELSDGASGVQVVTSGTTFALVSNLNGDVKVGDRITSSPISGVGMKALETTVTVGTAQADLSSVKNETRTVTDKSGKGQEVKIGLIPVQVSVAFYSPEKDKQSAFVPLFLQNLANNVTGRDVSPVRVLVAALILLLLFLSITVLLYSSVRSSIISIGRNPLSESAVRKSLFQVGVTVLAVLIFAIAIVYLVLTV